jgi:hypothetical protein
MIPYPASAKPFRVFLLTTRMQDLARFVGPTPHQTWFLILSLLRQAYYCIVTSPNRFRGKPIITMCTAKLTHHWSSNACQILDESGLLKLSGMTKVLDCRILPLSLPTLRHVANQPFFGWSMQEGDQGDSSLTRKTMELGRLFEAYLILFTLDFWIFYVDDATRPKLNKVILSRISLPWSHGGRVFCFRFFLDIISSPKMRKRFIVGCRRLGRSTVVTFASQFIGVSH